MMVFIRIIILWLIATDMSYKIEGILDNKRSLLERAEKVVGRTSAAASPSLLQPYKNPANSSAISAALASARPCPDDNFMHCECPSCNPRNCVPNPWICDGDNDCIGGSDEKLELCPICPDKMKLCGSLSFNADYCIPEEHSCFSPFYYNQEYIDGNRAVSRYDKNFARNHIAVYKRISKNF